MNLIKQCFKQLYLLLGLSLIAPATFADNAAILQQANTAYERADFYTAADAYELMLVATPDAADLRLALAHCYFFNRRIEAAEAQVILLLDAGHNDMPVTLLHAQISIDQGQWQAAESILLAAIAEDANNPTAHLLLGSVLMELGEIEDAEAQFGLYQSLSQE